MIFNMIEIIGISGTLASAFGIIVGLFYRITNRIDHIYSEYVDLSKNLDNIYNDLSKRIDTLFDKIVDMNKNNYKRNKRTKK